MPLGTVPLWLALGVFTLLLIGVVAARVGPRIKWWQRWQRSRPSYRLRLEAAQGFAAVLALLDHQVSPQHTRVRVSKVSNLGPSCDCSLMLQQGQKRIAARGTYTVTDFGAVIALSLYDAGSTRCLRSVEYWLSPLTNHWVLFAEVSTQSTKGTSHV